MNQFTFKRGLRTTLLIMIAIGIMSMVMTFMGDDPMHTRLWSNILHNSVFFTGIGLLAFFMWSVHITAWSSWNVVFNRLWEAYALFLIPGLLLMLIIAAGIWGGWHNLYHWADAESVANDKILQGKSSFLNKNWYTFGTIVVMGIWIFVLLQLRKLSRKEDGGGDMSFKFHHRSRIWAAASLPLIGFGSAVVIWLWVMSVDAHWYSTLFAWYNGSSMLVAMLAVSIVTLYYLKSRGYFPLVNTEHLHDLGKYLFAFSIFWAYLWFSQYMLIWYANIGEETIYFKERIDQYPVLFHGNMIVNFALPFLILLRNDTKRKLGIMVFVSIVVFIGHWLDFFLMIKPGILHTMHELAAQSGEHVAGHGGFIAGYSLPGFLEFGTMVGFLGFFLYFSFSMLTRSGLVPKNDPYLAESVHHHVE
jgi:hypothetical protein